MAVSTPTRPPKPAPPVLRRPVAKLGITERLARWCSAHPLRTLAIWALAIVSAVAAVALVMGDLTTEGHVTGSPESSRGEALIAASFPPDPKRIVTDIIVVRSGRYRVEDRAFSEFVHRNHVAAQRTGVVINATSYFETRDPKLVSRDGHATIIPLNVKSHDEIEPIVDLVARADADPDFAVSMTGDHTVERDFDELSQHDLKSGELKYGVPAALAVLLLVFAAIVAGLVPLLLAVVSIVVGLGLVALLSQPFELSVFILNMLTGMGLALGIDYSLFVISRYREERGRAAIPTRRSARREQPRAARSSSAALPSSSRCSGCCSSRFRSCAASRPARSWSGSSPSPWR